MADLFSECFGLCSGTITPGSPGPICGWTYDQTFSSSTGPITFAPGSMTFTLPTQNERAAANKAISGFTGINNTTTKFSFTEIPNTLLGGSVVYQLVINDFANADWLQIELDDSGVLEILVGPQPNGWSRYTGTWTPNNGSHVVHVTVDGAGIPRIWIDGIEHVVVFSNIGAGAPFTPTDTIFSQMADFDGGVGSKSGVLHSIFVATGTLSPDVLFCCP